MNRIIILAVFLLIFLGAGCKPPDFLSRVYETKATTITAVYAPPEDVGLSEKPQNAAPETPKHIVLPEVVRGIYLTSYTVVGAQMEKIIAGSKEARINAFVIDLKDYKGYPAFEISDIGDLSPKKPYFKIDEIVSRFHKEGFYLIARIPVFQDTYLAEKRPKLALKNAGGTIWRDNKGLAWVDPAAREVWNYNLQIAKLAYAAGFDEIQFDYIRFATDGATDKIVFPFYKNNAPKAETIKLFFQFLDRELRQKGAPISADLFGITFWSDYDYNIGQKYLDAMANFDFVSPMVYPSHFPANFRGYKNPAENPYEIIKMSMESGLALAKKNVTSTPEYIKKTLGKFRPWFQAFNLGAVYDEKKIVDQIRGACDAGATSGWLFWNARNVYNFKALGAKQTCY
ncbi:MAG: putative glycoside hydrolase [Patescibacteria group bacterium]